MSRLSKPHPSAEEHKQPPSYMTYEEFLEWADEDTLAEWVDGAIIMPSPVSLRHQDITNFLFSLLSAFGDIYSLGKVINGPFQMKLAHVGREPDLLYVTSEHLGRFKPTYLDGPADLVVEVVSPESASRDRGEKFYEYQEAGIPEYWLIDPRFQQAEFYQLDTEGRYQHTAPDVEGVYRSHVLPGFWLRVAWLWQEPLPNPIQALLAIDRDAYVRYFQEHLRQAES